MHTIHTRSSDARRARVLLFIARKVIWGSGNMHPSEPELYAVAEALTDAADILEADGYRFTSGLRFIANNWLKVWTGDTRDTSTIERECGEVGIAISVWLAESELE